MAKILVAEDGEQALTLARRDLPDLIMLDAMMPGLGGFEVLRQLKADSALRSVPVIMVTAKGHERDVLSGLRGGGRGLRSEAVQFEGAARTGRAGAGEGSAPHKALRLS
ncbi:MAG: response regulator [Gemmatimonadota bacterium]|nr:response regulator [Gemmatimonadota bacterium]